MSDDTPTERFEQPDAPTEILTPPPGSPAEGAAPATGEGKSRRTLIILLAIGGALLLAVLVLLIALLARGAGTPDTTPTPSETGSASASPTPTPSKTPSPSPTPPNTPTPTATAAPPAPAPPDNSAKISSFTVSNDEVFCNSSAPVTPDYELGFTWSSSNVNAVYFGVNTDDASQGAFFDSLPPTGTSDANFPYAVAFPCPTDSVKYTLTVLGSNGQKVSKSVTVTNIGDN